MRTATVEDKRKLKDMSLDELETMLEGSTLVSEGQVKFLEVGDVKYSIQFIVQVHNDARFSR